MPHSEHGSAEYDVIVLGVGGMGSATCYELARRGLRVLGLERFPLVHAYGSSHGETRIIRKAYFEHPDYVPLLHRSYERWHELEQLAGRTLLQQVGLVMSGVPEGETISGARLSAKQYGLELQNFTAEAARRRFPGFDFPAEHEVAFEPTGGFLHVEDCVRAYIEQAIKCGATIRGNEQVANWQSDGSSIRVRTQAAEYTAKKLVVSAGAWSSDFLQEIGLNLTVLRKVLGWFPLRTDEYKLEKGFPTYFFELPGRTIYGFPSIDGQTIKLAEHSGGEPVNDPVTVDRSCRPDDPTRLADFLRQYLPGTIPQIAKHAVCLYTMTADQHFVIDLHPKWKNVAFAAGFSGHGFKFCSVVGEILSDLAEHGQTKLPIEFLSLSRPALSTS